MELLVVMSIIILMMGIGVSAFRGGAGSDGAKAGASSLAALFGTARNEAILKQTRSRVIVDTYYDNTRPQNCYHRATVAYLSPCTADPAQPTSWKQVNKWQTLPNNVYFDPNYSNPHGKTMPLSNSFGNVGGGVYWYYEFLPNGQAVVSATTVQALVSPGRVNTSGNFSERTPQSPTSACYGFVLFPMGNTAFFQNPNSIQKP